MNVSFKNVDRSLCFKPHNILICCSCYGDSCFWQSIIHWIYLYVCWFVLFFLCLCASIWHLYPLVWSSPFTISLNQIICWWSLLIFICLKCLVFLLQAWRICLLGVYFSILMMLFHWVLDIIALLRLFKLFQLLLLWRKSVICFKVFFVFEFMTFLGMAIYFILLGTCRNFRFVVWYLQLILENS